MSDSLRQAADRIRVRVEVQMKPGTVLIGITDPKVAQYAS